MIPLILVYVSLVLSLGACVAACLATYKAENTRLRRVENMVGELHAEALNNADLQARLHKAVHKIRNRLNGDDTRKKLSLVSVEDGLPDPETDPEGWKLEIMRRNPRGALS